MGSGSVKATRYILECYCDNSPQKQGTIRNGLCIKSFADAIQEYNDAAICVASMWQEEIYNQICEFDPLLSEHIYDVLTTMAWETSEWVFQSNEPAHIPENRTAYESLYRELADNRSKETLVGILNYRLTRDKQ